MSERKSARKGLKRVGLAGYEIAGKDCTAVIRRNGTRCYLVGHKGRVLAPKFFTLQFTTLAKARAFAEQLAGI